MTLRKMNAAQRLTTAMSLAAPIQQHTPDQQFFRDSIGTGRSFDGNAIHGALASASHIRCNPDGTVDCITLDCTPTQWIDLGGQGGIDFRAGRY